MAIRFIILILLFISQSAFAYKWQNVDGGVFYVCGNNGVQKLQMIDHSDVKSVEFQQNGNKLPSTAYSISAIYDGMTVDAVITLKDGSVVTESIEIKDEPKWTLRVDESKSQLCNGNLGTLKAVVRQGTRKIPAEFSWQKDGAEVSTEESFSTAVAGLYSLTATAFGCTKTVDASIIPSPTPSISGNEGLCLGESLTLMASDMDSYEWQGGETSNSATFSVSGDYYVVGTKTIGKNVCRDTLHFTIKPKMSANIEFGGVTAFCPGTVETEISADHDLSENQIISYEWSRGGVPFSNDKKISVTEEDRYRVVVKTVDGCKSSSEVVVAHVDSVADVVIPNLVSEICSGHQTTVSAEGVDLTYFEWKGSGTSFGTGESQYALSKEGDYSVVGYTTNGCKSKEFVFHISEIQSPTIFLESVIPCEGDEETISCTVTQGSEFFWVFPDSISGITSTTIKISNSGQYRAQVKDPVTGCVSEAYTDVEFLPYPEISLIGDLSFCKNEGSVLQVEVDNRSNTKYKYSWVDANGKVIDSDSLVVMKKSGDYQVLVSNSHNCETRKDFSVVANPAPKLKGDTLKHLCENSAVTLTVNGAEHYQWSKSGKKVGSDSNKYRASSSGTFMVVGTSANGCSDTAKVKVELAVKPKITDIVKPACGTTDGLIALQTDKKCMFKWPDGSADSTFSFSTEETYTVVVTDSLSGCRTNHKVESVVREIPVGLITSAKLDACEGDSLTIDASFTAQDGDVKYSWNCSTDTLPTIVVKQSGRVVVSATDSFGCVGTTAADVVFHKLPQFEIQSADVICMDSTATLVAQSGDLLSYVWQNGYVGNSIVVDTAGTYICTATDTNGCVASKSKCLLLNSPKIQILGRSEICVDSLSYLSVNGDFQQFYWDNKAVDTPFYYAHAGLVTVVGIDSFGCKAYADFMVHERKRPSLVAPDTTSFCDRESVDIQFFSIDAVSFTWDGKILSGNYVSTDEEGEHLVVGYDTAGCPSETQKINVKKISLPTLDIDGKGYLCGMNDSVTLVVDVADCNRLHWNTGDTARQIDVYRPGKYTVVGYNGECVSDTAEFVVSRTTLPKIEFVGGKTKSFCKGDSVAFEVVHSDDVMIKWTNERLNNSRKNISAEGFYVVEATDSFGCMTVDSVYAKESPSPFLSISGDSIVCENRVIELVANGVECEKIVWSDGSADKTFSVDSAGVYWAVGYDKLGCGSDTIYHLVKQRKNPTVSISGITQIASSQTATLTANVINADSIDYRYLWMPGRETSPQIVVDVSHINMYENYSVTVYDKYGCSGHTVVRVTSSQLSVDGKFEICEGDSTEITLFAPTSNSVVWSNGGTKRKAIYKESGAHYVVSMSPTGASDTVWFKINVHSKPYLKIVGNTWLCEGDSLILKALTDGEGHNSVADGPIYLLWSSGKAENEISVYGGGKYTVVATDSFGCMNRDSILVVEYSLPTIEISGVDSLRRGETAILTASGGKTYSWGTEKRTVPSIEITHGGRYKVIGTDSVGCSNVAYKDVMEIDVPVPLINDAFDGEVTICEGDSVSLIASGGDYYIWDDGRRRPEIYAKESRRYKVSVCLNNGECRDASFGVRVLPKPEIDVIGKTHICDGEVATLNVLQKSGCKLIDYDWSNGKKDSFILVADSCLVSVSAKDENGCVSEKVEYAVHRYDVTDVIIDGDFDICEDSSDAARVFLIQSNVAESLWIDESNGDTLSKSKHVEFTKHGKYSVSVVDKNGCIGQKQFIINQRGLPKVEIVGAETPVCNKQYARLIAISDSKCKYEWSTGDDGAEISATQSGEYSVVATNEYGCKSSTSTELIFNDIPDMSATGDFRICPGENVVVGVTGADEYVWSDGSKSDECVFIEACNGYVIGRDRYGCQKRIDFKIEEIPVPTVSIAAVPAKIKRGESEVSLYLDSGDDLSECTFIWLMSDGGTSSQQSFSHEFNVDDASLFSAVAVVETKDGCKLRLHTTIETEFVIPNTFTPNGDMINDHFMKGYHVEIKDRHGIMLYQGEDGWNGILPNGKVTPDTYYYIVTDATGQKHYGYVTVAM